MTHDRQRSGIRLNERGALLGLAMIIAVIGAFTSYAVLQITIDQALHAKFHHDRTQARYAAEVGIVWAQQRLLYDETYCGAIGPPLINGMAVDVTVTNCGIGNQHTISATVIY